jgi:hypothetical protein
LPPVRADHLSYCPPRCGPTASRARASVGKTANQMALFRRQRQTCQDVSLTGMPLSAAWPPTRTFARVAGPRSRTSTPRPRSRATHRGGSPPATDSLVTVEIALHGSQLRDEIRLSIHQREERPEVASVERVIRLVGQLHVLLRHRLLPLPGGFESFGAIGKESRANEPRTRHRVAPPGLDRTPRTS